MESRAYLDSPIGILEVVVSLRGVRRIRKVAHRNADSDPMPDLLANCLEQLTEYFEGTRQTFQLPLDWSDEPEFHKMVWEEVVKVPYGHTTSYLAIAEKLNNPKAVRAVGQANANNPIAIVVPCHRVIAKSGDLQGYFYGLEVKRQLLELENPMSFARQGDLFS